MRPLEHRELDLLVAPPTNGNGTWIRWALGLLFAGFTASLGFAVNLSNRTTMIEAKEENAQRQRAEIIESLGELRRQTRSLDIQVTILNQFLEEYRRDRGRSSPSRDTRMFDK